MPGSIHENRSGHLLLVGQAKFNHADDHVIKAGVVFAGDFLNLVRKGFGDIQRFVDCFRLIFCVFNRKRHAIPLRSMVKF